jgi:hypothetical protein
MIVVVGAAVVVGASVEATVVGASVVVAAAVVVVTSVVDVAGSADVVVSAGTVVDVGGSTATVTLGSSTNSSLGVGRPAMATPATAPTAMTARANGQDLRMGPVKLPAHRGDRQRGPGQRRTTTEATFE